MYILSGNSTNSCLALSNSFCVLKHKSFISLLHFLLYYWKWVSVFYFRETFFRNLKIVDWYTFGSINWFAVDINITLKSLLNMTFHETYMWLFLWPQKFFLIESSCKFIFFHMNSDTFTGSYDLRHFNWKVVWKTNWVNVLYKSQDAVLLYQLCCSRLVYLRCHLFSFHSVKPKSFDWRILLISYQIYLILDSQNFCMVYLLGDPKLTTHIWSSLKYTIQEKFSKQKFLITSCNDLITDI